MVKKKKKKTNWKEKHYEFQEPLLEEAMTVSICTSHAWRELVATCRTITRSRGELPTADTLVWEPGAPMFLFCLLFQIPHRFGPMSKSSCIALPDACCPGCVPVGFCVLFSVSGIGDVREKESKAIDRIRHVHTWLGVLILVSQVGISGVSLHYREALILTECLFLQNNGFMDAISSKAWGLGTRFCGAESSDSTLRWVRMLFCVRFTQNS